MLKTSSAKLQRRKRLWEIVAEMHPEYEDRVRGVPDKELLHDASIPEDVRYRAYAQQRKLEFIDPREDPPQPGVESYLPPNAITGYKVYPYKLENGQLIVLTTRPGDVQTMGELRRILAGEGLRLQPAVTTPSAIEELVNNFGIRAKIGQKLLERKEEKESADQEREAAAEEGGGAIVEYVNALVRKAYQMGASDIHIEPEARRVVVRYRVDGRLRPDEHTVPPELAGEIITRIKVMAGLNVIEHRLPQDGRISFRQPDFEVNVRVSTGPVHIGDRLAEQVVMRLLPKEDSIPPLENLGFSESNFERFKKLIRFPNGIVLVTGPTGSGKSTTLASALRSIATPEIKILSIEDPVEYRIPGVIQSQVNEGAGYTFARALRAFLRQDPDVIYVGEVRDHETASIAVQAALTGHLVFGTLHTNDAPSTVTRLLQMGLKPYNVAGALRGVLAQRLVRRVCKRCAAPLTDERTIRALEEELGRPVNREKLVHGTGKTPDGKRCPECGGTGYKGRLAIHELFVVTPEIEAAIVEEAPTDELYKLAVSSGMTTLRIDGLAKVEQGLTTYEEVINATLEVESESA